MKRSFLLAAALLAMSHSSFAKPVAEQQAAQVGQSFLALRAPADFGGDAAPLSLLYKSVSSSGQQALYYVFGHQDKGFVIVAADDQVSPVLGYSSESAFNTAAIPAHVKSWLDGYGRQIQYVIDHDLPANAAIRQQWDAYATTPARQPTAAKAAASAVSPMVATRWNQSPYYNDACPYDNAQNGRAVTGCVATAMAQIMKYWNYPATGAGSHSYYHPDFGQLSANFGATTYSWGTMPNSIGGPNAAIAQLMYHCGVSVEMDYGVSASGALVISYQGQVSACTENALTNYFRYKNTIQGLERSNYTDQQWNSLLKAEIDAGRPVLYTGFGSGGGHAFVCDGYDANSFYHFNWGWGGAYDGYFGINALNPAGVGTGGGAGGFNNGQEALIGIEPQSLPAPDGYEVNNTLAQAYTLPVAFSGANAVCATPAANFHNQTDSDYYKVVLPAGYDYTIAPRLHDAVNSTNGNTYTVDAQFQFSLNNGASWSLPYDYALFSGNLAIANGGTVYFRVTPRYRTNTGSYLLNLDISRTQNATAVIDLQDAAQITVYPTPAHDFVHLDLGSLAGKVGSLAIFDMQGRQAVAETAVEAHQATATLPVQALAEGVYFLHIRTEAGLLVKKILVQR